MTTLHRAADLIDFLVARGGLVRPQDMVGELGVPRSTIHRLCGSLVEVGLLHRDVTGAYGLGPRLVSWSMASNSAAEFAAMAQPLLRRLSEVTGEASSVSIARGAERICLATEHGRHALVPQQYVGMRRMLGFGPAGKVLLAHADPPTVVRVRAALVSHGRPVPSADELAAIRGQLWATSHDEQEVGLSGAAVPVFGPGGTVIAAVALGGSSARLHPDALLQLRAALGECADGITALLQGRDRGTSEATRP